MAAIGFAIGLPVAQRRVAVVAGTAASGVLLAENGARLVIEGVGALLLE